MLIAQCPNCKSEYRASQSMVDSYDGFFRCGKCDYRFNFHDQFSGQPIVNESDLFDQKSEIGRHDRDPQLDSEYSVDSVDSANNLDTEANSNPLTAEGDLPPVELDEISNDVDSVDGESESELNSEFEPLTAEVDVPPIAHGEAGGDIDEKFSFSEPNFTEPQQDEANIVFNQYDDLEDESREPKLGSSQDNALFTRHDTEKLLQSDEHAKSDSSPEAEEEALAAKKTSDESLKGSQLRFLSDSDDIEELYDDEGFLDESLLAGLEDEYELQRKAVLGESDVSDQYLGLTDFTEPKIGDVDALANQYINGGQFEPSLSILDDVEDEPKVIGSFGVLWLAIKQVTSFFFWFIIILMLLVLLVYQFKPTLSTGLQDKINDSPVMVYLCKFVECGTELNPSSLDVVVSRMDLNPTPSEPLNVSLSILNKLKKAQAYPVVKLSLKNLQGLTVGQRFVQPEDYLANPSAVIPPGDIGKIILKLDNPPENAVGFEVSLH